MSESFDLQAYLSKGIEDFMKDLLKATLTNPRGSAFMLRFAAATAAASRKRRKAEDNGLHIPSFLIASITSQCNLHCAGCYSRCNHATVDAAPVQQLTSEEWLKIFSEADELGISFILLAGGEPMLRRDIIEAAGKRSNILFPIFTNGTFMDERYFDLFDRCRNLVPIMSIEGEQAVTDARRGKGRRAPRQGDLRPLGAEHERAAPPGTDLRRVRHRDDREHTGGHLRIVPKDAVRPRLQGGHLCGVRAGHRG